MMRTSDGAWKIGILFSRSAAMESEGPRGRVSIDSDNNHAWLTPRVGRWTAHPQNVLTASRPT